MWAVPGQDGRRGLSVNISVHEPRPDVITCSSTQRKVGSYLPGPQIHLQKCSVHRVEGRPEVWQDKALCL